MAWSDVQLEQMVSFNDASSSGIPLNSGQSHSYTGQCMTKDDITTKYAVNSSYMNAYTLSGNRLVPKKIWSYIAFSSWYTNSGSSSASTSGTVTVIGSSIRVKAFSTIYTGSGATLTTTINIGGNIYSAYQAGLGTTNSSTFDLVAGTYYYSVSCSFTGSGAYQGGISYVFI
jgi:hypothetical protein